MGYLRYCRMGALWPDFLWFSALGRLRTGAHLWLVACRRNRQSRGLGLNYGPLLVTSLSEKARVRLSHSTPSPDGAR